MEIIYYNTTIGKINFLINSENLRLSAKIGSNLTFIGGTNNNGYFKNINDAKSFIEQKRNEFLKCKTMNKLIYL